MPTQHAWREFQDLAKVEAVLDSPEILWIHRPILLHRRNTTGERCGCGCNSKLAISDEPVAHLDLLVDRVSGIRKLRHHQQTDEELAEWDAIAANGRKIELPLRCYDKQLQAILDHEHMVVAAWGGVRGGKTSILDEALVDRIIELGGAGFRAWWVSPTQAKTQIAIEKLCRGFKVRDRVVPAVIPEELIAHYPEHDKSSDQVIRLIDGSQVHLKFASKKGGNLRGDAPSWIGVDETCVIQHESNWHEILNRVLEAGGQVYSATTPIAGHWAREKIYDVGFTYEQLQAANDAPEVVQVTLTSFDNPWIDPADIERRIKAGGGREVAQVRRDIFGEWVGEGPILWAHFRLTPDPKTKICHLRSGPWRHAEEWGGLVNVTPLATGHIFTTVASDQMHTVGGQDFNLHPMSVVVAQIVCPANADQSDPKNWILFVLDEVIKFQCESVFTFADFLATEAGNKRRLRPDLYAGLPIVCDATGAQNNPPAAHGISGPNASLALAMQEKGFPTEPCHYDTQSGKPKNPNVLDRVSLGHMLMLGEVKDPRTGETWPRLIVHAERCPRLIHSLRTQERNEWGRPIKESGKASDRLSGPTDALTYLAWAVFASHELRHDAAA